jgi:streptogramin lyase
MTGPDELICRSMGFLSRHRGRRLRVMALVCLAVFAASAFTPSPLAHAPPFRRAFGQQTLSGPGGVAIDPVGDVWVADTGHDRVDAYSPSGRPLTTFGNDLDSPAGIATDATGHVWVADTGHDRIVEFSPVGRVLAVFGSPGQRRGQLDQPVALAVTPFGDVWVAD